MKRRHFLAAATGAATVGALGACSTSGDGPSSDKVSIMLPLLGAQPPAADGKFQLALEAAIGTKLDIQWVPTNSYDDKFNIALVGGDMPDLMVAKGKTASFVKNALAGAFWDLTDKVADYPNLKTSTHPKVREASMIDGKLYGIYRQRAEMRTSVTLRKDWLSAVGLELPKNTDDLFQIAKAFTEQDPGKTKATGIGMCKWPNGLASDSMYDIMETWFGAGNLWAERDGKLVYSFTTPEFLDTYLYLRKFVAAGYMNKDFATMPVDKWNPQFMTGKAGINVDTDTKHINLVKTFKQKDPKTYTQFVTFTGNLLGPSGKPMTHPTEGMAGQIVVPKGRVKTDAQLDTVLAVLDKLNSDAAQTILYDGIKDVTYTIENGLAVAADPTEEVKTILADKNAFNQIIMNQTGYTNIPGKQGKYEMEQAEIMKANIERDLKSAVYNPAAAFISQTYLTKGVQLDTIITDTRIKFLAGQIDEKGLQDAVALWRSSGGDQIMAEINEARDKA